MRVSTVLVVGVICAAVTAASPARAQNKGGKPDESDIRKAQEHYANAQKAMKSGDYVFAASQFGIAYEYTKDPVIFYQIANANHQAGDCEAALVYYGRYLREAQPDEEFEQLTRERITECEAKVGAAGKDDAPGTEPAPTPTPPAPPEPTPAEEPAPAAGAGLTSGPAAPPSLEDEAPSWQRSAAWVSVGATVAFATAGAVLGLSASSREEDVENLLSFRDAQNQPASFDGNTRERYEDLIDEGQKLDLYSKIAFGVAGVAAVTAATFFILDGTAGPEREGTALAPMLGPDSVGVSAGWEF